MTGEIRYNYPALEVGVADMRKTRGEIESQVQGLIGETKKALQSWNGSAAGTYGGRSATITNEFTNMTETLNRLARAIDDSKANTRAMDRLN